MAAKKKAKTGAAPPKKRAAAQGKQSVIVAVVPQTPLVTGLVVCFTILSVAFAVLAYIQYAK